MLHYTIILEKWGILSEHLYNIYEVKSLCNSKLEILGHVNFHRPQCHKNMTMPPRLVHKISNLKYASLKIFESLYFFD